MHQHFIDARGMEPPRPFELVMEALDHLESDGEIVLVLGREPYPLYRVLEHNGYTHSTELRPDGALNIHIAHA
ncbi:MAG: DUF2249 domain-containing protein [Rhodocyclaceae bacterium]|nr:DUF2249 domain-containing protein [Rhodocyclaceae bacterium]